MCITYTFQKDKKKKKENKFLENMRKDEYL